MVVTRHSWTKGASVNLISATDGFARYAALGSPESVGLTLIGGWRCLDSGMVRIDTDEFTQFHVYECSFQNIQKRGLYINGWEGGVDLQ